MSIQKARSCIILVRANAERSSKEILYHAKLPSFRHRLTAKGALLFPLLSTLRAGSKVVTWQISRVALPFEAKWALQNFALTLAEDRRGLGVLDNNHLVIDGLLAFVLRELRRLERARQSRAAASDARQTRGTPAGGAHAGKARCRRRPESARRSCATASDARQTRGTPAGGLDVGIVIIRLLIDSDESLVVARQSELGLARIAEIVPKLFEVLAPSFAARWRDPAIDKLVVLLDVVLEGELIFVEEDWRCVRIFLVELFENDTKTETKPKSLRASACIALVRAQNRNFQAQCKHANNSLLWIVDVFLRCTLPLSNRLLALFWPRRIPIWHTGRLDAL